MKELNGKIDLVLDGGQVELGVHSTVVNVSSLPVKILRKGAITEAAIQEISSKKRVLFFCTGNSCRSVIAKALLEKRLKEKERGDVEVFSNLELDAFYVDGGNLTGGQRVLNQQGMEFVAQFAGSGAVSSLNASIPASVVDFFNQRRDALAAYAQNTGD